MNKPLGNSKPRSGLVAALDLGSSKVTCVIARLATGVSSNQVTARVVGIGQQKSHGLKSGSVIDLEAAEATIRATVEVAESMVGENIHKVFVNLSCGKPKSKLVAHEADIGGREIEEADLYRVLTADQVTAGTPADREMIHSIPVGYSVDDNRGVRDPRGMYGARLGANVHLVTAQRGPVKNLRTVIDRCQLEIEAMVATPFASALACLVDDERQLGTTCIDIGGGVTSLAIFCDGELVHTDVIPLGGGHMTNDIARGLSTPIAHAERLKTLHGNAIASIADERDMIDVPQVGEDIHEAPNPVPRSILNGIIQPRMEETFELVRAHLKDSGVAGFAGRRVVLTGGASQL
ncbi:MAG: cell division protein FtsA, partial [Rhodospirillales bacterium]